MVFTEMSNELAPQKHQQRSIRRRRRRDNTNPLELPSSIQQNLRPAFSASEAKLHLNPNCEAANTAAVKLPISPENEMKHSTEHHKTKNVVEDEDSVPVAEAIEATAVTVNSPTSNTSNTGCSNCFGRKKCKRWVSLSNDKSTPEMSEVYCPTCDDAANETPACLSKMPDKKSKPKHKTILSVESELIVSKRGSLKLTARGSNAKKVVMRSASLSAADRKIKRTPSPAKKIEKEKDKAKTKDKGKDKETDVKDKTKTKTTNLLAKVSPKRIRSKTSTITTTKTRNNNETINTNENNSLPPKEHNSNNNSVDEQESISSLKAEEYEIADDATSLNGATHDEPSEAKIAILSESDTKHMINVRGREELPVVEQRSPPNTAELNGTSKSGSSSAGSSNLKNNPYNFEKCILVPVKSECHPLQPQQLSQESLNAYNTVAAVNKQDNSISGAINSTTAKAETNEFSTINENEPLGGDNAILRSNDGSDYNGNCHHTMSPPSSSSAPRSPISPPPAVPASGSIENGSVSDAGVGGCFSENSHQNATLPRAKRNAAQNAFYQRAMSLVPKRRTPDGTNIYYWCDLPRRALKELDDGAYNPLWASRGFTQTFHFWKENRRQQSTPLNAFLTYVTLPWWSIAKDLLDHRETPILTF